MEPDQLQHPPLPRVELGVVLGFVCPRCLLFSQKYSTGCGCYACAFCHHHVPQLAYKAACDPTAYLVNHPSAS